MDRTHLFPATTEASGGGVITTHQGHVLICGVNWLGDSCMAMPAIQAWKQQNPSSEISLLIKPPLIPLWECNRAIDNIIPLAPGNTGPFRTGKCLRKKKIAQAYIFPNSWRSAIPPLVAGIPHRTAFAGHYRKWMLTDVIPDASDTEHQQWEYARILGLPLTTELPLPELRLPPPPPEIAQLSDPVIGILPGAARGSAKRWPAAHFIQAARKLLAHQPFHFAVCGTSAEKDICQEVTQALAPHATCLAGTTSLPTLAASLQACTGVLSNDSGGMHLAAAVGTPVVAMFGLTDPNKTGPIGPFARCLQPAGVKGSREISRQSAAAERILASIPPVDAATALLQLTSAKQASPAPPKPDTRHATLKDSCHEISA